MITQIEPLYSVEVRSKRTIAWQADIPQVESYEPLNWPVNKTVCVRWVDTYEQYVTNSTIRELFAWCVSKKLSLLEYGFCIVREEQNDSFVSNQYACFRFKKLKHAFAFKLRWENAPIETDKKF